MRLFCSILHILPREGCIMESQYYWELFMATGAPGFYLKYQACLRTEDKDVSENTGSSASPDGVQ